MIQSLELQALPAAFSICRMDPNVAIPAWALKGTFFSISRTTDELSIVCLQSDVPESVKSERDWRCLKVRGPLDFALTGILAALATPLAEAGNSIFAISTFDTDYVLVKQKDFIRAIETLRSAGQKVVE